MRDLRVYAMRPQSGDLKFAHHFGRNCGFTFCEQLILHDWVTHSKSSPGAAPPGDAAALAAGVIGPRGPACCVPCDGGGAALSTAAGAGGGVGGSFGVKRLLVDVHPARPKPSPRISIAMNNRVTSVSPLALLLLDACARPAGCRRATPHASLCPRT